MDSLKVMKMIQDMKAQLSTLEQEMTGTVADDSDMEDSEPDAGDSGEASEPAEDSPSMSGSSPANAHGLALLLLGKKKK